MTPTFRLAALAALALCAARPARADWTGTMKMHTEPAEGPGDQQGKISGKAGKLRMEMEQGKMGKMAMVIDLKEQKMTMIMAARHSFMTMDMTQPMMGGHSAPIHVRCETLDVADCLTKQGFKKSGAETVNGTKSDKWEADRDEPQSGKVHETLWIPQGVKGFAMVKQVSKSASRTTTLDVLDFKETSLDDALFAAPADFTDMSKGFGPMMGGPGGRPQ